nr:hypothetical protein [Tanacetum cinerariifolium]
KSYHYNCKIRETYKNVSQDIRDQLNAEAKAVQIILTGIDNDIYSTVDACPNACDMWKAIERLKHGESINVQDLETNLYWEFGKFTSQDDDETSKDKKIDKLIALISLSFKKIYKPTNNNLRTSSNTSRTKQDNSPKINRSAGYKNQRNGNVAGARETVGSSVELEAHYMYMAQLQEVSPDPADSGTIFDDEPVQNVSNDDHYNVFAMKSTHPEQSKSMHDTYPIEQDAQNVIINSLDMNYDREEIDQNDDDNDLTKERELLASLIEKLKCEIDESKNHNKFLETSNNDLIEKLKDKLSAHQETISILSKKNEAQIKLYKSREDKELDKVIELENKVKSIFKNTNVIASGMYKIHTDHNQTRTSQLPQDSRKTNKRMSFSTGVIPTTSVSRPQLKSNPMGDRVMRNSSQGKKREVKD